VAPVHIAGTVDIRVTTPSGMSATSSADQYTYVTMVSGGGRASLCSKVRRRAAVSPARSTVGAVRNLPIRPERQPLPRWLRQTEQLLQLFVSLFDRVLLLDSLRDVQRFSVKRLGFDGVVFLVENSVS